MRDPEQVQRALVRLAERRISEAMERGEFDNLPGAGRPLADLDEPYDEWWWVRKWLGRQRSGDREAGQAGKAFRQLAAVEAARLARKQIKL